jgi:ADP-ribosylglycohydrolase
VCALGDDVDQLRRFVRASTRLTHTDPKAERGAMLIALAAHHAATFPVGDFNTEVFLDHADAGGEAMIRNSPRF